MVVGEVADTGPEDLEAAIAAARRAFDETEWSADHSLLRSALDGSHPLNDIRCWKK